MANTLYYGDNLEVLRRYIKDETVDLCYIDPPFNSKRNYNQIYNNIGGEDRAQAQAFVDTWVWDSEAIDGFGKILSNDSNHFTAQTIELIKGLHKIVREGSLLAYLVSMTLRIVEIHRALKPTGSFYLHCDPTASHYLKLVLDSIFVTQGGDFRNEIIWHYRKWSIQQRQFVRNHDVIFFYSKTDSSDRVFNQLFMDRAASTLKRFGKSKIVSGHDESGRRLPSQISEDVHSEGAAMACFITLQDSTGPMRAEAKTAGTYTHPLMQRNYDKIQIVTIKEIIEEDKRLDIPMSLEVLKAAQLKARGDQLQLLAE